VAPNAHAVEPIFDAAIEAAGPAPVVPVEPAPIVAEVPSTDVGAAPVSVAVAAGPAPVVEDAAPVEAAPVVPVEPAPIVSEVPASDVGAAPVSVAVQAEPAPVAEIAAPVEAVVGPDELTTDETIAAVETLPEVLVALPVEQTVIEIENVIGTQFADVIIGDSGENRLDGGDGDDVIGGRGGDDTLVDGYGNDLLHGGSGDDVLIVADDGSHDKLDGGDGRDTLDLSDFESGVYVDHHQGIILSSGGEASAVVPVPSDEVPPQLMMDEFQRIEVVVLGVGNDVVVLGPGQADYYGGAGEDTFVLRDASSSGKGKGNSGRDRILDFEPGDKVDLGGLVDLLAPSLADKIEDNDINRFKMIRDDEEFSDSGQLRMAYETEADGTEVAVLQGNIDHDSGVDFEIELRGYLAFSSDQIVY